MQINTWDALWFLQLVSLFRLCSITTHWGCPGLRSLAKRMRMLFSSLQVARGTGRPAREARHLTARPLGGRARCPMEDMTAGTFRQSIDTAIVSALKMRDHLQFFMRVIIHCWDCLGLNQIGQQNTTVVRGTHVTVRILQALLVTLRP